MTTNRTAIRRWLQVGGSAHRPPFATRKARHRTIVAPLAATLAATAAVGIGVVLARAGGERRSKRLRRRERRLGLSPDERLTAGLRRMAIAQAEMAIEELEGAEPQNTDRAVHETRKAIKRLRTIVRLLESQLGKDASAREHASLRAAAAVLADARDAEVMLETLEGLVERHRRSLAGRRGIRRLQAHLSAERDRTEMLLQNPVSRASAANELRAFRSRAGAWHLTERPGIGAIDSGLEHIYRQGRRRGRRAARGKGGRMRTMHQWRKRVKDLRYAAEILERPTPAKKGSRARQARAEAKWMRKLAKRADELGELLGEEHDLAVFAQWLRDEGKRAGVGRGTRRRLEKVISARRAELRRRALRDGRRLYRRSPKKFVARVRRASRRTGPKLS